MVAFNSDRPGLFDRLMKWVHDYLDAPGQPPTPVEAEIRAWERGQRPDLFKEMEEDGGGNGWHNQR